MTRRPRRLSTRLLLSHGAVVALAIVGVALVANAIGPSLFEDRVLARGEAHGQAHGRPDGTVLGLDDLRHDFGSALDEALLVGLAVGLVAAIVASLLVTRRILRPIDDVRRATARLAAGDRSEPVPMPDEVELAALAADANRLAGALEHSEQARARLLADVAHELRTPLTTIRGYMEGLIDGVIEPTPEVFADVADETARLERLVGDINTVSRADEGVLALERTRFDLRAVGEAVAQRLRAQFDDAGIVLDVPAGEPIVVDADRDRVTQVVTNLAGNALAYTPPGGSVRIDVSADRAGALVTVSDDGDGIAAEDLDRIFERFVHGAGSSRTTGGTGIGLTVARSIARAHGGDVTAASPGRGQGSTFTFRLPLPPG